MKFLAAVTSIMFSCGHTQTAAAQELSTAPPVINRVMISIGDIDAPAVEATLEALGTSGTLGARSTCGGSDTLNHWASAGTA